MIAPAKRALLGLVFAAAYLVGCDGPTIRCDGREVWVCESSDPEAPLPPPCKWHKQETCPVACVEFERQAFCALGETFAPTCPAPTNEQGERVGYVESHCEGSDVVVCWDGYIRERTTCPEVCVDVSGSGGSYNSALCETRP